MFSGTYEEKLFFLDITDSQSQVLEFYLAFLMENEVFSDAENFDLAIIGQSDQILFVNQLYRVDREFMVACEDKFLRDGDIRDDDFGFIDFFLAFVQLLFLLEKK